MPLVGDILISARELFPDLPQLLSPPAALGGAPISSSNSLPTGTYYIVFTQYNQWGQSLQSSEISVTVSSGQAIQITGTFPANITQMRAYLGLNSGGENVYVNFTALPLTIDATTILLSETPPTRSTAYLPDSDGGALSAAALYRWLNDGLFAASTICDGLPDFSAVGSVSGQPIYNLTGTWKKVSNAWYDGYPLSLGRKTDVFRRNNVTGLVGTMTAYQSTNRLIVELWPQPSRTSGQTTTTATMTVGSNSVALATSNFVLGFGLAMIGTEMVEFGSNAGGVLAQLTRGMGGTIPQAWPASTPVTELNVMVSGHRVPTGYSVGQAPSTFYLPPGWEHAMETYLISRFKKAEQQVKEAQELMQEFESAVKRLNANRIVTGPRQISASAGRGSETYPGLGSIFGGVIVP